MDHWNSVPAWGWMLVASLFGYAVGMIHLFYKHWVKAAVYCPRCRYYLNWRDTVLAEVIPDWARESRPKDPWERENPPESRPS